jgi:hypothetical protein
VAAQPLKRSANEKLALRAWARWLFAWLAPFCLAINLSAAVACELNQGKTDLSALGAASICHAGSFEKVGHGKSTPASHPGGPCPFCALHCCATMAAGGDPLAQSMARVATLSLQTAPIYQAPSRPTRTTIACPRGPPAFIAL